MSFPSFNLANLCTSAKVRIVEWISSNCLFFSLIPAPIFCRVGSSCSKVHNSMAYSKTWVQPLNVSSKVVIPSLIAALCYSLTSRGVVGYNFSCNTEICSCNSNQTWPILSLDSSTITTRFWIFSMAATSIGILSSRSSLQTWEIVASSC